VFRIAINHLKNYQKITEMTSNMLKSEKYQDLTQNVEKSILVEELKLSCTNVMLQCLDSESRSIFLFGTMFKVDRRIAGEILEITPEVSRQRRSRIRKNGRHFLGAYCGESGSILLFVQRIFLFLDIDMLKDNMI
jgi:hypothetical protein